MDSICTTCCLGRESATKSCECSAGIDWKDPHRDRRAAGVTGAVTSRSNEIILDNLPIGARDATRGFSGAWCQSIAANKDGPTWKSAMPMARLAQMRCDSFRCPDKWRSMESTLGRNKILRKKPRLIRRQPTLIDYIIKHLHSFVRILVVVDAGTAPNPRATRLRSRR